MPRLAVSVLLLALLAATATAFALTEVLKLERTPIVRPRFNIAFSPGCACGHGTARLPIRLKKEETIDATIVDSDGDEVRTLLTASRKPEGRFVLRWDGRNDSGATVPDGTYRVRLRFERSARSIVVPNPIRVDTEPPVAKLVSLSPRSVTGKDTIEVVVDSSERARLLLFADGTLVARGKLVDAGDITLVLDGAERLGPGQHALSVAAVDRAGNSSTAAGAPVQVVVR